MTTLVIENNMAIIITLTIETIMAIISILAIETSIAIMILLTIKTNIFCYYDHSDHQNQYSYQDKHPSFFKSNQRSKIRNLL